MEHPGQVPAAATNQGVRMFIWRNNKEQHRSLFVSPDAETPNPVGSYYIHLAGDLVREPLWSAVCTQTRILYRMMLEDSSKQWR
jgi:hypothetical protein